MVDSNLTGEAAAVGPQEDAFGLTRGEVGKDVGALSAPVEADAVVMGDGGARDSIEPVGGGAVVGVFFYIAVVLRQQVAIVGGGEQTGTAGDVLGVDVSAVTDSSAFAALGSLTGGDKDDTVCSAHTIDGGGGSVLQDGDVLNVRRRDIAAAEPS